MPKSHTVVFTRAAREAGIPLDEISSAALATTASAKEGEIWFRSFRVRGRQFALSTRVIVEVDCFPHRAPEHVAPPARRGR